MGCFPCCPICAGGSICASQINPGLETTDLPFSYRVEIDEPKLSQTIEQIIHQWKPFEFDSTPNCCESDKTFLIKNEEFIFKGTWSQGKPHGKGVIYYLNGDYYEGHIVFGVPEGRGRLVKTNGETYIGSFSKGAPSGELASEQKVFLSNLRKGVIDEKKLNENDEKKLN